MIVLEGGVGRWGGEVGYRIFRADGEPLSELRWPLNIFVAGGGGRLLDDAWETRVFLWKSVTDDAGTVENSDWEADNPDLLTTYSESDATLDAWALDAGARCWLLRSRPDRLPWKAGAGAGYLFRSLSWKARDLDQWYPQEPFAPHDRQDGTVGTYRADIHMPYGELAGAVSWGAVSISAHAGVAPWMYAHDEDDHKLRHIRSETDAYGLGWKGGLSADITVFRHGTLSLSGDMLGFRADGTEENEVYDGPQEGRRWRADHEIRGLQYALTLSAGITF